MANAQESLVRQDTETVIFGRAKRTGFYRFAQRFQGDFARQGCETASSYILRGYKNAGAFKDRHFAYDAGKQEITGSSPFINTAIQVSFLNEKGLWLPGVTEGKALDAVGKLTNGVYRDFSGVVYSNAEPNRDIAETLIKEAGERTLPFILPFKALVLTEAENKYNLGFKIAKQGEGIIHGEEARRVIATLDSKADSGFRRLSRHGDGSWYSSWPWLDSLALSSAHGRVDWVCGEAAQKNLEDALYNTKNAELSRKRQELEAQLRTLADKEQTLKNETLKIFNH